MQTDLFIKFLSERNRDFIDLISSESALGLVDCLHNDEEFRDPKRKCVVLSFDPPLGFPPIIFNWKNEEIWYVKRPQLNEASYKEIEDLVDKSDTHYVIIVERKGLDHKRKIMRWIKNFKETRFRNKPLTTFPKFILAEYKNPLFNVNISEIKAGDL